MFTARSALAFLAFAYCFIARSTVLSARTVYGCQFNTLNIECWNNTVIKIMHASYGRDDTTHCPISWLNSTAIGCTSESSHFWTQFHCAGRQSCSVYVVDETFGGDPCWGIAKYLKVTYMCVSASSVITTITCDEAHANFDCGSQSIVVVKAFYGRDTANAAVCPAAGLATNVTSCAAPQSFFYTQWYLLGRYKNSGSIYVTPGNFGTQDPCPGVAKYLYVQHRCIDLIYEPVTRCDGQNINLLCGSFLPIVHIHAAYYGRDSNIGQPASMSESDPNICPVSGLNNTVSGCADPVSYFLAQYYCGGKTNCTSPSITNANFARTPQAQCLGAAKYLYVQYSCELRCSTQSVNFGCVTTADCCVQRFQDSFGHADIQLECNSNQKCCQPVHPYSYCSQSSHCCTGICGYDGRCSCLGDRTFGCSRNSDCCVGACTAGWCCKPVASTCTTSDECCSRNCQSGKCQCGPQCFTDSDCCSSQNCVNQLCACGYADYRMRGCYSHESVDSRLLNGPEFDLGIANSPAACTAKCKENGYTIAGTLYAFLCTCGTRFYYDPWILPPARCFEGQDHNGPAIGCVVDPTQPCGGDEAIAVFDIESKPSFRLLDCYEDKSDRLLESPIFDLGTGNSPAQCTALCRSKGYKLAGVQYLTQCFCGNTLRHNPPITLPSARCFEGTTNGASVGCAVDSTWPCGGGWAMAVYAVEPPCQQSITIACESATLTIRCASDRLIKIVDAFYGRDSNDETLCKRPYSYKTTDRFNCFSNSGLFHVQYRCAGKQSCSVMVSNENLGGDPCTEAAKYLQVKYECVLSSSVTTVTACENANAAFTCPSGQRIDLLYAVFRDTGDDVSVCPAQNTTGQCVNWESFFYTQQAVQNTNSVTLNVTAGFFGGACGGRDGIAKYLQAKYQCLPNVQDNLPWDCHARMRCSRDNDCCNRKCSPGGFCCQPSPLTPCVKNSDCCSNQCANNKCCYPLNVYGCSTESECCTGLCKGGKCCLADLGTGCAINEDCCTGLCQNSTCCIVSPNMGCTQNADCCRGQCNTAGKCCIPAQQFGCTQDQDCCNGKCSNGKCCASTAQTSVCSVASDCCSSTCTSNACACGTTSCVQTNDCCGARICNLGTCCLPLNSACSAASVCCSGSCVNGHCAPGSKCNVQADCVSGTCNNNTGQCTGKSSGMVLGPALYGPFYECSSNSECLSKNCESVGWQGSFCMCNNVILNYNPPGPCHSDNDCCYAYYDNGIIDTGAFCRNFRCCSYTYCNSHSACCSGTCNFQTPRASFFAQGFCAQ